MPELRTVQVLMFVGIASNKDSILATKERCVGNEDNGTWPMDFLGQRSGVKKLGDRARRKIGIFSESFLRAFAVHRNRTMRLRIPFRMAARAPQKRHFFCHEIM